MFKPFERFGCVYCLLNHISNDVKLKRRYRLNSFGNENRLRIYNFIKENPGVYFREIIARLKINKGTVEYHLRMLKMAGMITSLQNKGYKHYFLNGSTFSYSEQIVLSALREGTTRKIIDILLKNLKLSDREIARFIGISRSTVAWHMKTIAKNGIVASEKVNLTVKRYISPEFLPIVRKYAIKTEIIRDEMLNLA